MKNECDENTSAIIGYKLKNTLSEHGTVSRGVFEVDSNNLLTGITERIKIYKKDEEVVFEEGGNLTVLKDDTNVSMNFWCFHPHIFSITEKLFAEFPKNNTDNIKAEFFIPYIADYIIKTPENSVVMIPTSSQWFGVTYKEDAAGVKESLYKLIEEGEYPERLWS